MVPRSRSSIASGRRAPGRWGTRTLGHRDTGTPGLSDIADAVGLKRNSLYRYFPDKGHLVAAWFRSELTPLLATCRGIADRDDNPSALLDEWLDVQLDYLTAPDHQALLWVAAERSSLGDEVRQEIGAGHHQLYATLATILARLLAERAVDRDLPALTMLVAGLLRSTTDLIRSGHDAESARTELRRAAHAITS